MPGPPPMPSMPMGGGGSPLGGPPPAAVSALDQMSQAPSGAGDQQALMQAQAQIQVAYSRVMLRSPKAAKALSDALGKLNQALMVLDQEAQQPVAPPPELLGALGPAGGASPLMGMGSPY